MVFGEEVKKNMRSARTIVFFTLFLSIGVLFLHFQSQELEKRNQLKELAQSQVIFPGSLGNEIDFLSFERSEGPSVRLKKTGGEWQIVHPVNAASDRMVVLGIVTALRFGKKEESFQSEEDPQGYGFKKPALKLVVGTAQSGRNVTLVLGKKVPLKDLYYAKWEGSDQVFLISEELWKAFDRDLLSLRRRFVFDFELSDVLGIRLSRRGEFFDVWKEKGEWTFGKDSSHSREKVNPMEVEGFLKLLRSLAVGQFEDGEDWKDDRWGLRLKQNYVSVYVENQPPQILHLGYPSREWEGVYIHRDKVFPLALVSTKWIKRLERTPESFYNRTLQPASGNSRQ